MPIDVRLPIGSDEQGVVSMLSTSAESVQQQIRNILLTNPGERIFDASYGVGLKRILFETNNQLTISQLIERINQQLRSYASFIEIKDIKVQPDPVDNNTIRIGIDYKIKTLQNYQDTLQLEFNNVLTI
jgi:phage baseplate assembly protein W